jgi:hypothetical protein
MRSILNILLAQLFAEKIQELDWVKKRLSHLTCEILFKYIALIAGTLLKLVLVVKATPYIMKVWHLKFSLFMDETVDSIQLFMTWIDGFSIGLGTGVILFLLFHLYRYVEKREVK